MNITLSLDEKLVKNVRKIAVEKDTTLTGVIRAHLEHLAVEHAASGRKRREREALERSFSQFEFRLDRLSQYAVIYLGSSSGTFVGTLSECVAADAFVRPPSVSDAWPRTNASGLRDLLCRAVLRGSVGICRRSPPYPGIHLPVLHQSCSNRILENVVDLGVEIFRRA